MISLTPEYQRTGFGIATLLSKTNITGVKLSSGPKSIGLEECQINTYEIEKSTFVAYTAK